VTLHILLDSFPLGALSHPAPDIGIVKWVAACRSAGHKLYVPEVIDYEVRRELPPIELVVATSNVGHISRFVSADLLGNIRP